MIEFFVLREVFYIIWG